MNIAFVQPKIFRRRLAKTDVIIEGKKFTKDFGIRFAPLRHNWTYSMKPQELLDVVNQVGFVKSIEVFSGIADFKKKYAVEAQSINEMRQRYLDDWIPALDDGLRKISIRGSILFALQTLILGSHFGFSSGFWYYVLFQLANTEGMSYIVDKNTETSFSGNSMFLYSNVATSWLLINKLRGKSGWLVSLAALYGLYEFVMQFREPQASKGLHFLGMFLGWAGYRLFL